MSPVLESNLHVLITPTSLTMSPAKRLLPLKRKLRKTREQLSVHAHARQRPLPDTHMMDELDDVINEASFRIPLALGLTPRISHAELALTQDAGRQTLEYPTSMTVLPLWRSGLTGYGELQLAHRRAIIHKELLHK